MPATPAREHGYYTMSVTPFNAQGALDEGALREHLRFLASGGVGVYLASVGTGEAKLLSRAEIRRIYEIGVQELKGKTPVYAAGLGLNDTGLVIDMANEALAIGVDAVYLYGPRTGEANHPTQREIEVFFADVLEKVKGPVLPANNMSVTGYEVPIDILAGVAKQHRQRAVGIPSAHGNFFYSVNLAEAARPTPVYVSMTAQLIAAFTVGISGALGHEGNVAPHLCRAVCEAYHKGDHAKSLELFGRLMRLAAVLARYGNPRAHKAALALLGRPCGDPRRPYLPVEDAARKDIARVLDELEIRKYEGLA